MSSKNQHTITSRENSLNYYLNPIQPMRLESLDESVFQENNLMMFLKSQEEKIFKISNKLKKADLVSEVHSDFFKLAEKIKSKFHRVYKTKITASYLMNYDHSVFDLFCGGSRKMHTFQGKNLHDTMIAGNNRTVRRDSFSDSDYNENLDSDNIDKDFSKALSRGYSCNSYNEYFINKKGEDIKQKENTNKKIRLQEKINRNNEAVDKNKKRRGYSNDMLNINISSFSTGNILKPDKNLRNKRHKNISSSNSKNKINSRDENYLPNEMSLFPIKNNADQSREKFLSEKINEVAISEQNLFEITIKNIIFCMLNAEEIFFSKPEPNKKCSFNLIFLFLKFNFISDISFIHTLILKMCKMLKSENADEYSESIFDVIEKLRNTRKSTKFPDLSDREKMFLIKILEEKLENLINEIKANHKRDPINNYFQIKDEYVKNIIARKVNEFEVSEISDKIVSNSMTQNENQSFNNFKNTLSENQDLNRRYNTGSVKTKNKIFQYDFSQKENLITDRGEKNMSNRASVEKKEIRSEGVNSEEKNHERHRNSYNSDEKFETREEKKMNNSLNDVILVNNKKAKIEGIYNDKDYLDFDRRSSIASEAREKPNKGKKHQSNSLNKSCLEEEINMKIQKNSSSSGTRTHNSREKDRNPMNLHISAKLFQETKNQKMNSTEKSKNKLNKEISKLENEVFESHFKTNNNNNNNSMNNPTNKNQSKLSNSISDSMHKADLININNDLGKQKKLSAEKTSSLLNSASNSSMLFNNFSSSKLKKKLKEDICTDKIIDYYIQLKYESEILDKKLEELNFNNQLITNFSENEMQYLYLFKCILEKIDDLIYKGNQKGKEFKSQFFKEKFFFLLFRTKAFGEFMLKEYQISSNFLNPENKAIFLDRLYKIGKFLFNYLLENENLKQLDFRNRNEFTKLAKNIFNNLHRSNNFQVDKLNLQLILEKEGEAADLISLQKLNFTELYTPFLELRIQINSILKKLKNLVFAALKAKGVEEANFDCYTPHLANSLNYLYFYNSNMLESSEIFVNFNVYNLKSKNSLLEIIEEVQESLNLVTAIKEKTLIDSNDGVIKFLLKVEKEIKAQNTCFYVYLSFNCEDCFHYESLLNYAEYDPNVLYLFRIFKFFLIQRNLFYCFSSVLDKQNNKANTRLENLLFDNISLLSLIVVFFLEAGLIPYKESNFEFRKFYCQRINQAKAAKVADAEGRKVDEYYYFFPYPLAKSNTKGVFSKAQEEIDSGKKHANKSNLNNSDKRDVKNNYNLYDSMLENNITSDNNKYSNHINNENLIKLNLNHNKNKNNNHIDKHNSINKSNNKNDPDRVSKIHALGNLFINFCYFVLNLIKAANEAKKKNEENLSLILDIEKLLYFHSFGKDQLLIVIAGMEKFVNTVSVSQMQNLLSNSSNNLSKEKSENFMHRSSKDVLSRKEYENFIKNFKTENKGKDTLVHLTKKKLEVLEKEFIRLLHYFLKENDEDFLKAFFIKDH